MNPSACGSCEKTSENKFFNCPPKMSDGRHFTDYRPRCAVNYPADFKNAPMNSYDYRQYLINNAEALMSANLDRAFKDNACGPCVEPFNQGTMLPEQNMQECNASTCKIWTSDTNGLGLGRKFGETPEQEAIRKEYLESREKLNKDMKSNGNCCFRKEDDANMWSVTPAGIDRYEGRYSVPGGGEPFSGTSRL